MGRFLKKRAPLIDGGAVRYKMIAAVAFPAVGLQCQDFLIQDDLVVNFAISILNYNILT